MHYRLASLDEAMIIQKIYQIDNSENSFHWKILADTLDSFYERIHSVVVIETDDIPPFDYKKNLPKGFPNTLLQEPQMSISNFAERRKKVLGYVRNDGWEWDDVIRPSI